MNIFFKMILLIVCLFNSVANALEFKPFIYQNRQILLLIGEFVQNDFTQFYNISQKLYPIHEIWLHSPGGSLQESLQIGRRIRELRITTIVPSNAECDSACTFAFLGGVQRYVSPQGAFGVHMFSNLGCSEKNVDLLTYNMTRWINAKKVEGVRDIAKALIQEQQASAQIAKIQTDYVLEMGVSVNLLNRNYATSCNEIDYLKWDELVNYHVVNATP